MLYGGDAALPGPSSIIITGMIVDLNLNGRLGIEINRQSELICHKPNQQPIEYLLFNETFALYCANIGKKAYFI